MTDVRVEMIDVRVQMINARFQMIDARVQMIDVVRLVPFFGRHSAGAIMRFRDFQ